MVMGKTINDWEKIDTKINLLDSIQVSNEDRKNRYKVCITCDKLTQWDICKVCNCWMPLKAKIPIFKCPLNKWQN